MVAEQVKHDQVLLRLREHDPALSAKTQLKDSTQMNLAYSQPSVSMWLAERFRKLLHGVGELLPKVKWSVFELALDPTRQRDSHARRRGLVTAAAKAAGDSCTWAMPVSNSARASLAR